MSLKTTIVASAIFVAMVSMLTAQDVGPWDLKERMGMVIYPTGEIKRGMMTDVGHNEMTTRSVALPAGTAVMRRDNKLYVVHDARQPDGSMLFDRAGNWMSGL